MKRHQIASLDVLELRGKTNAPVIILFHGYGASANDLFPLCQELSYQKTDPLDSIEANALNDSDATWIFPNGIVKVPLAPNMYGRAWFPINIEALEQARISGKHRDLASHFPEGLSEARERAEEMIKEIIEKRKINYNQIIIGGFSQGAMLATDIVLRNKQVNQNFAKLIILSGTLLAREEWTKLALEKKGISFFASHGKDDPILSFDLAEELYSIFTKSASWEGTFIPFSGGHEIPLQVLSALKEYIHKS